MAENNKDLEHKDEPGAQQGRVMMVVFEDVAPYKRLERPEATPDLPDEYSSRIAALEQELGSTKEYLQTTIEELETSNEELKSTNEELQSANEELQSVNEELVIVNTEHQNKIDELSRANNALNNLLASIEGMHRLAAVVRDSNDAITMYDIEGNILAWNRGAEQMYGWSEAEALGQNIRLVVPEEKRADVTEYSDRLFRGEQIVSLETQRVNRDGRILDVWLTCTVLVDETGQPHAIATTERDITERKQAEEALRQGETRYRRLFEDTPISIWEEDFSEVKTYLDRLRREGIKDFRAYFEKYPEAVIDCVAKVKIMDVNQATLELYQAERKEELLGDLSRVFTEDAFTMFREELIALAEGETKFKGEVSARTLTGDEIQIDLTLSVVPDHETTLAKVVVSIIDVSERQQAEDENARLLEAVSQQSDQLRFLAARLAEAEETERKQLARELHDQVGQNLTALGLNLNIIRAQLADTMSAADPIYDRLDDSLVLVEEVTERIRDVMTNLRPPVLDDYGLVAALRWYSDRFAAWTGLTITVQGEEPDPRLPMPVENALFRTAQEALTNAAKHAQATRVTVTVAVDNGTLRLIVADDGVGFEPAGPAEFGRRQSWGLLSMTERVEAVGGHCRIESCTGQGTRVIVETMG